MSEELWVVVVVVGEERRGVEDEAEGTVDRLKQASPWPLSVPSTTLRNKVTRYAE